MNNLVLDILKCSSVSKLDQFMVEPHKNIEEDMEADVLWDQSDEGRGYYTTDKWSEERELEPQDINDTSETYDEELQDEACDNHMEGIGGGGGAKPENFTL